MDLHFCTDHRDSQRLRDFLVWHFLERAHQHHRAVHLWQLLQRRKHRARRLIEERLHLEQAVAELETEIHRIQFRQANDSFRWDQIDQGLLTAKTHNLAEENSRRVAKEKRRIQFECAQNGNSASFTLRWFDFMEQEAGERAEKIYAAYRETWLQQNRVITPSFIRAVRDRAIADTLAGIKSSVEHSELMLARQQGRPPKSMALAEWSRRMGRLAARWNRRLEGEAVAAEYGAARQLGRRSKSSNLSVEPRAEPYVEETPFPDEQSLVGTNPKISGRPSVRPAPFINLAGGLWSVARRKNGAAKVSRDQLRKIASELDEKQFVPPAKYLESDCASQVKAFNSKNSNSKVGPILTWSELVTTADKDHLRGMRRLLSRCAAKTKNFSICPMSEN